MRVFFLLLAISLGFINGVFSLNTFTINATYFEGHKIKAFSENRGGAVVLLDNGQIFLMNKQKSFENITSNIDSDILNDVLSIESINESTFLIGTTSQSLFLYKEGLVTRLLEHNPDLPLRINSIDFDARVNSFDDSQVMIGTSDGLFASNDLVNYRLVEWQPYMDSVVFYGNRNISLLTDFNNTCSNTPGEIGLRASTFSGTVDFPIHENEIFNFETLHDVQILKIGYGSFPYNLYALYGTENGIYVQNIYSCSSEVFWHFEGKIVYDFELVEAGLNPATLFVASDSGLLYHEKSSSYWNVYDMPYSRLEGIDTAYSVTYSRYHNNIWVGTNNGLLTLSSDNLTREQLDIIDVTSDTIDFCKNDGWIITTSLSDQIDAQWFRNDTLLENKISTYINAYKPGNYSLSYNIDGIDYNTDIAYLRYDSTFNERITDGSYLICPDFNSTIIEIQSFDYRHSYKWYSLERGLEWDAGNDFYYYGAQENGHYFFIVTNCNGYEYVSDTVTVTKSALTAPTFSSQVSQSNYCTGDTIFVEGAENAILFKWWINSELIETTQPYLVLNSDYSEEYLYLTVADQNNCELSGWANLKYVFDPPVLSGSDLEYYICEPTGLVYVDRPYGSKVIWAGESIDGIRSEVSSGSYPIIVTNEVCTDFEGTISILDFNPIPLNDSVIEVPLNDTLKIPMGDYNPVNYSGRLQIDWNNRLILVTSKIPDTLNITIDYFNGCFKSYEFEVRFIEGLLGSKEIDHRISLYPNPTHKSVFIKTPFSRITSIRFMDMNGKTIYSKKTPNTDSYEMPIPSHINDGIYVIQIFTDDGGSISRQLIINSRASDQ